MQLLGELEIGSEQALETSRIRRIRYHLLSYQAENYIAINHLKKAEELLQQAHELANSMQDREVDVSNSLHRAALSLAWGSRDKAYEQLKSAIILAKETNLPDLEWRGHYLLGNLLRKEGNPIAARSAYQQAIRIIESLDLYVPERELRMSFLAERYDPYRAMVTLQSAELKDEMAAFDYFEKSKARMLLNQLENKPRRAEVRTEEFVGSKTLDLIQRSLPQDLLIVEYFTGNNETLIFIVSARSFDCLSLPVGKDKISSLVNIFLDHMRNGRLPESKSAGKELYKILIFPIKSHLKPQSTLCIVPDGSLFYVPFPALITEEDRFLIEEYRFTRAPSAAVLKWHLSLNKGKADGKARKVLVIASDENLQEAKKEAEAIYEYYKPYSVYLGQPDQRALAGLVHRFEILHFAGHTKVWKDGSPAMVFASPRPSAGSGDLSLSAPEPGDNNKRVLRSNEVMRWNLSNVRLINLSACGTGLGKYLHGEGVVGLTYAFLSAGAPALLVSLWEVDGTATRLLMERFYENLQKDGMSKAEALRRAQINMINSNGPHKAPYYWASFILVGDPR